MNKEGVTLLLFYAYVEPAWGKPSFASISTITITITIFIPDEAKHKSVLEWANGVLTDCGVTGRLRVAKEGFNGTLTGGYDGVRRYHPHPHPHLHPTPA